MCHFSKLEPIAHYKAMNQNICCAIVWVDRRFQRWRQRCVFDGREIRQTVQHKKRSLTNRMRPVRRRKRRKRMDVSGKEQLVGWFANFREFSSQQRSNRGSSTEKWVCIVFVNESMGSQWREKQDERNWSVFGTLRRAALFGTFCNVFQCAKTLPCRRGYCCARFHQAAEVPNEWSPLRCCPATRSSYVVSYRSAQSTQSGAVWLSASPDTLHTLLNS